jgi:diguanylate cyclase (GGDEF)-like protein
MSDTEPPKSIRSRILIADDAPLARAMLRDCLSEFHVEDASDGLEALARVRCGRLDVMIIDMDLPGLDGPALLAAIGTDPDAPEVIVTVPEHDRAAGVRGLRLGAHAYLTKPPRAEGEVSLAVTRALERRRLRQVNARLRRQLVTLARVDHLTGLGDHRAFAEVVRLEVARARRHAYPLAIVLFEIDDMTAITETHGPRGAADVLQTFARVLLAHTRSTDALFRLGGERFVAVLPYAAEAGAREVVSRIDEACASVGSGNESPIAFRCTAGVVGDAARAGADLLERAVTALNAARAARGSRTAKGRTPATAA